MKKKLLPPLSKRLTSRLRSIGARLLSLAAAAAFMTGGAEAAVLLREDFTSPAVTAGTFTETLPTGWTAGTLVGTDKFYLANASGSFFIGGVTNYSQLLLMQNVSPTSAESNLISSTFSAGVGTVTITGSIATRNYDFIGNAYGGNGGLGIYFDGTLISGSPVNDLGDGTAFTPFSFTYNNTVAGSAHKLTLRWTTTTAYGAAPDNILGIDWLQVDGTALPIGTSSYWSGASNAIWSNVSNWNTDATSNVAGTVPTSTTDVFFGTTTPAAGNLNTVLDIAFSLNSLTFSGTSASVTIGNGGNASNTLTLGSGGITVQDNSAAHTINADVVLGANQTWSVGTGAGNLTVNGGISGTGIDLTKSGAGKLILTGNNSYAATTISGGILQVGNGGTSGTLGSGAVVNNATLTFNRSDDVIVSNNVSGTGAVIKDGAGKLTLSGTLSHTGTTTVNAGTLEVSGGADITQSAGIVVGGTGTLKVDGIGSTAVTGNAGGSSAFDVGTSGNLVVGETGVGKANVTNGGSLQSSNYTFISYNNGAQGTLTVNGPGSSFTSALDIRVGSFGTGTMNVQNGATVTGQAYDSIAFGTDSVGTVTVTGKGSTWNTANFLSIGLGVATVGAGGNGSNAQGGLNVFDGGLVATTQDARLGSIGGSTGTALVDGLGSQWTIGGNLYVGGLSGGPDNYGTGTINANNEGAVLVTGTAYLAISAGSAGTLNIGDGGSAGTFTATEINGGAGTATVNFEHSNASYDFATQISGSTAVNQIQGTTTLSGASTYTGATSVTGGALNVTGSLDGTSSVTVNAMATFGGTGSVTTAMNGSMNINGALVVGDTSVLPPVASTLSLTTSGTGSVVMGASSFIIIDLFNGAGAGDNTGFSNFADLLSLTGKLDASAGGTLVIANPNAMTGFAAGDQWKIIDLNGGAGSILGKLKINDTALGLGNLSGELDPLTGIFSITDSKPQQSAQQSGLQTAAAEGQAVLAGMQGMLGDINGRLFNLRAGWGEETDDSIGATMDFGVVVGEGDGPESPIAKKELRSRQWEVFTTVNYANINLSSICTQAGVKSYTWAPGIGIERHFTRHLAVGFAASLMETHQTYTGGLGTLDIEGVALSTYASYVRKSFWGDVLYSFGRFDLDSQRNPGFAFPVANGNTAAWTNAVQLNGGWNFRFQNNTLVTGPFIGLDYLHATVDAYAETGGGAAALAYNRRSYDSLISRIGWSVSKQLHTDWADITPQVRVSYERQNMTNNNGTSVNLINQPFTATTNSQAPGQDYMVVGAGVNFQFTPQISMLLTYQGQFMRQDLQAHYAGVRFSYKF